MFRKSGEISDPWFGKLTKSVVIPNRFRGEEPAFVGGMDEAGAGSSDLKLFGMTPGRWFLR